MEQALAEFLRHLALEKNASTHTIKSYREDLTQAVDFFRTRLASQTPRPEQLTTRLLARSPGLVERTGLRPQHHRSSPGRHPLVVPLPVPAGHAVGQPRPGAARSAPGPETAALRLARGHDALAGDAAGRFAPGAARSGHPRDALLRRPARQRVDRPGCRRCRSERRAGDGARQGQKRTAGLAGTTGRDGDRALAAGARTARRAARGQPTGAVSQQERHAPLLARAWAGCWRNTSRWPHSIRAPARTRCDTASRLTCSTPAPTSAAFRSCSGTAAWPRPRCTRMLAPSASAIVITRPTPAREPGSRPAECRTELIA